MAGGGSMIRGKMDKPIDPLQPGGARHKQKKKTDWTSKSVGNFEQSRDKQFG